MVVPKCRSNELSESYYYNELSLLLKAQCRLNLAKPIKSISDTQPNFRSFDRWSAFDNKNIRDMRSGDELTERAQRAKKSDVTANASSLLCWFLTIYIDTKNSLLTQMPNYDCKIYVTSIICYFVSRTKLSPLYVHKLLDIANKLPYAFTVISVLKI